MNDFLLGILMAAIFFFILLAGFKLGERSIGNQIQLCGHDRIECYQRVLGMEQEANE